MGRHFESTQPATTISYCPPLTECNFFDWPQASVSLAISKMSAISSYQNKTTPALQASHKQAETFGDDEITFITEAIINQSFLVHENLVVSTELIM